MPDLQEAYIGACPVGCAAPLVASDILLPEGPLLRCAGCGQLVSQVSVVRYWETMAQFDGADFNRPAGRALERRRQVAGRRLNRIAALLGKPPQDVRLVDVGCSRGHFVATAAKLGFQAEGVEPAPHMVAAARSVGIRVHQGLLEEQRFPDESFDALTLFEVVEHLRDPLPLLRECRRVVKPGGVLVISTGNTASWTVRAMGARWDYFHIAKDGGHISFFNLGTMRRLAANAGFAVESIETARVKFFEKTDAPPWRYVPGKVLAELLNLPAKLLGKGHDLLAYLRRPQGGNQGVG